MDLPLNVDVHCTDGLGGCSTRIIVDPASCTVTHLVVADKQAPHTEYLVPISYIRETTPEVILISCTRQALRDMEPFFQTEYLRTTPADIRRLPAAYMWPYQPHGLIRSYTVKTKRIPCHEQEVPRGTHAQTHDGNDLGEIEEFLVESTSGQITHIVLRQGRLWHHKALLVPGSEIERIEEGIVYLNLDKKELVDA
jgi:sporulation protein YlmC with PRC-barrel domain